MPADQILAPNPSLAAILFVVRTQTGPRAVFHYPPTPTLLSAHSASNDANQCEKRKAAQSEDDTVIDLSDDETRAGRAATDGTSQSEHDDATSTKQTDASKKTSSFTGALSVESHCLDDHEDDDISEFNLNVTAGIKGGGSGLSGPGNRSRRGSVMHDMHARPGDSRQAARWDQILGFDSEGLVKLLCPSRDLKRKRFEISIESLVFLGYPVFVREDGHWKRRKTSGKRSGEHTARSEHRASTDLSLVRETAVSDDESDNDNGIAIPTTKHGSTDKHHASLEPNPAVSKSFQSNAGLSDISEARSSSTTSEDTGSEMTMFHIVFIMDPPPLEYHIRVDEMYDNVAKKFAKALKFEQAGKNYVWRQAKHLIALRNQAREKLTPMNELWTQMLKSSTLAATLASIYDRISANEIARVVLSRDVECSLQIPQRTSTAYAPSPAAPQIQGLYLSTAWMLDEDGEQGLSPYAALLLLQDKTTLLKEIESDNRELAVPLAYFVREMTPSKSLQKLATRLSLRVRDLQILARHLIYWRRARAVPPLHVRNTYTVSPYADMRQLATATEEFERLFPGLPSLPKMLQSLSSRPVPYGYFIPTQDHKAAYMDILAWLLRGAWVTNLRTFAWVRVSAEVKAKVASKSRQASRESTKPPTTIKTGSGASEAGASDLARRVLTDDMRSEATRQSSTTSMAGILSPLVRTVSDKPSADAAINKLGAGPSDGHLTSSHSGFFAGVWPANKPSPLNNVDTQTLTPGATPMSEALVDDDMAPSPAPEPVQTPQHESSLILAPYKATAEESQWLACIGETLTDRELREAWPTFKKYLDGKSAIEGIAAREGMKASRVWNLFARFEKEGVLSVVRHW